MTVPTLGQLLLGTEGLALLRTAFTGDAESRDARLAEMRDLLARYDAELATSLDAPEFDLRTGYDLWSRTYDEPLRLFPIEEPRVHELLGGLAPCRVLDAACGTGRHSAWLASRGHEVTGMDASAAMLARGRAKLPHVRFQQGDLTALPLADSSVDAALCALAMVHLPDVRPAVAELARAVRPGGMIVISDVHPFVVQLGWQAQFRQSDGSAGFIRLHPHRISDYAQAAVEAGLRVINLYEPLLTADAARTMAQGPLPEANAAAWVGLPGVVIWHLEKPGKS
jgi:SAM-dependent methyltransferase